MTNVREEMASEREALRRLHEAEPVTLTNAHAAKAAETLSLFSHDDTTMTVAHATLAVAQEIKNLRLAMYPHSGEEPTT